MKHLIVNSIMAFILLLWASIAVVAITVMYMIFMQGNPPVEFKNEKFPLTKATYRKGEHIEMIVDVCKKKSYPFTVYAQIIDGFVISLDDVEVSGSKTGCSTMIVRDFKVPQIMPEGVYFLRGKNVYHVNRFADRVVEWETQKFNVL